MKKNLLLVAALIWIAGMAAGCTVAEGGLANGTDALDMTREEAPAKEETPAETGQAREPSVRTDWPVMESPPPLTVQYGSDTLLCQASGFGWRYPDQNGEWIELAADSPHPLDFDFTEGSLHFAETESTADILLSFEVPPVRVGVNYWDGKYRQEAYTYYPYSMTYEARALPDQEGDYLLSVPANQIGVFEIEAEWEQKNFHGSAHYGFLAGPQDIFMDVREVMEDSITVVLQNHTGESYHFDEYYSLEVLKDGKWQELPYVTGTDAAFDDIAYVITTGGMQKMTAEYLLWYGALEKGEYRIVKTVMKETAEGLPADTKRELTAEFTIE